jgi:hypothetical protein
MLSRIGVTALRARYASAGAYHRPDRQEDALPASEGVHSRREVLIGAGRHLVPSLAAAAIAGFLIAGVGGRLAMFLLRVTSGDHVVGLESDDGFIIGRVTTDTVGLVAALTVGAAIIAGPLYAIARLWITERWRPAVFALFFGIVGGALLVHSDGVDFMVLSPRILAVTLFVAIPATFGGVLEPLRALADRGTPRVPRWVLLTVPVLALGIFPLVGAPGIGIAAVGLGAIVLGHGARLGRVLESRAGAWAGRVGILAVAGLASVDLARDLGALF